MASIVNTVARRFLTGKKRNTFLSFIAFISLFGVCLGVGALTVVMGVMEGFETQLRAVVTGTYSHITLYSHKQMIPSEVELEDRVRAIGGDQIEAMSSYVQTEVMLARGPRVVGSILVGIEPESARATTDLDKQTLQGGLPQEAADPKIPTITLSSNIAETLGAKMGAEIRVISPFFEKDSMQPRSQKFLVGGIVSSGMYDIDSRYVYIHVNEARKFLHVAPSVVSAFKIKTKDPQQSHRLAVRLKNDLGYPYAARDWTEYDQNFLRAVRLQKMVIFIILTGIILVAAFNIMSTLMMMMSEKKKEVSILKAMGLSPRSSARIFLIIGLVIGLSGAAAGVALGLLLCLVIAKTRLIQLPGDVYYLSYLPVDVQPLTLLFIVMCAVAVALIATLYPSYRVGIESPVEGLRYE